MTRPQVVDGYFVPVGFMDMTSVTGSTSPGSGIGTNFVSISYANAQTGALSETFLSPQNSRIGMQVDTVLKITRSWVLGV